MNKVVLFFLSLFGLVVTAQIDAESNVSEVVEKVSKAHKVQEQRLIQAEFLTPIQLGQLYEELVNFIEMYDAEGIETRNFSKTTQWQEYKKLKQKAFLASNNWQDLKTAFDQFAAGFVNLHSHFSFNSKLKGTSTRSSIGLGFTFPEISFFNPDSLNNISEFNQQSGLSVFKDYEQISCGFNSTIGCLNDFVGDFNRGKILIDGQSIVSIKEAGQTMSLSHVENIGNNRRVDRQAAIDVSAYDDWSLLTKGYKVAVLEQKNQILLVIKNFSYGKGAGGGFRCEKPAEEQTMCADIQLIRKVFNQMNTTNKTLIINVQNNGGGNENTPFLAELSQAPFKDLAVQFKNTPLLKDEAMRDMLFYGSDRAENWYQSLSSAEKDMKNEWLPVRADFCRADKACQLNWIKPNSKRKFKAMYILTNDGCVSSCDDLVWRLNEFSGAKVTGLPQAADATYSRVSGTFYLDSNNQINQVIHADGKAAVFEGIELFSLTIPYSKTLTDSGQIRQGRAAPTHFLLPITKENFSNHAMESVKQLSHLINNSE